MKKLTTLSLIAISILILANCSVVRKSTTAQKIPVTFENNIQSLVTSHCAPCHTPSKGGNKANYETIDKTIADIDDIIRRIELEPGQRGYMPFKKPKLSDSTIAIFKQWKEDGLQ